MDTPRKPPKKRPEYQTYYASAPRPAASSGGYGAPHEMRLDLRMVQHLVMTPRIRTRDLSAEELAATRCIHGE